MQAAKHSGAKALLCPTFGGRTARIMSSFRPRLPIIATSPDEATLRRCCFYWGVSAVLATEQGDVRRVCMDALRQATANGLLQRGDVTVITAGDPLTSPMAQEDGVTTETPTNIMVIAEAF